MNDVFKTKKLEIPYSELNFSFVRSSGPGGQNVNKVNSKAVLRWRLATTAFFSGELLNRLMTKLSPRLSNEGDLIIMSDRHRDQKQNKDDCIEKLSELLEWATTIPKARKESKPTRSSKRRTREAKGQKSETKKMRGRVRE
ncbi:MAG: aminoacyl-tRNA hydrolase [Cryobacterium sp.]|nr:aminoacyl-tRNA hydrolase [Oligoflexia bacterium]